MILFERDDISTNALHDALTCCLDESVDSTEYAWMPCDKKDTWICQGAGLCDVPYEAMAAYVLLKKIKIQKWNLFFEIQQFHIDWDLAAGSASRNIDMPFFVLKFT